MTAPRVVDLYPASPMQQGMLFHTLYTEGSGMYVEQVACLLRGALDVEVLREAWQQVVDRHPVLRSSFVWDDVERPLQVVQHHVDVPFRQLDWSARGHAEQQESLRALLREDRQRGFDLAEAPLMRLVLIALGDGAWQLVWSYHHILMDGWCNSLLLKELVGYYEAGRAGRELHLPPPRPYRDYIGWLKTRDALGTEAFWRRHLQGFTAPTRLLTSGSAQAPLTDFVEAHSSLSRETTAALRALARGHQLTLNTLVQGAWALLLGRYSGADDVVFGSVFSGRPADLEGVGEMIGLFINTLPVRVRVAADEPLVPWLRRLQAQLAELRLHEHTPLVDIQGWSDVARGTPLFDSIVVYENYPFDLSAGGGFGGLAVEQYHVEERGSFPLSVLVAPSDELRLGCRYYRSRFDDGAVRGMLAHLANVLEAMTLGPGRRLGQFSLLSPADGRGAVTAGAPPESFPQEECLHERFERRAARNPDAVALTDEGRHVTYAELNARANRLAHFLRARGVGPDVPVALCLDRSAAMVTAILGVLKAGGAYVPLDPDSPPARMEMIVADSGRPLLLTQRSLLDRVAAASTRVVCLDEESPAIAGESAANPRSGVTAGNLAYVIYTSGSTGQPKGVLIDHAAVGRLFAATAAWFHFDAHDVWTLFHSYAFDFSVWELWGALLHGGRIVVVPYASSRSPEAFCQLLRREGVTVLNQTPSAFRQLIRAEEALDDPAGLSLRYVIFGGEALDPASLRPWLRRHGDRQPQLVNMYGITETTVHVTYRPLSQRDVDTSPGSMIGAAIPDLALHLLDAQMEPVPRGVAGELYVGGAGVARGYLNRADLTAERFVPDPLGAVPGGRVYRSGDLGRRLPEGDVEYLGRIDEQVKVRGFRIELGEIESALGRHPSIREAVVGARDDGAGGKQLVAWVVTRTGGDIPVSELHRFLKAQLPDYMVPSVFTAIERLPLTINGKDDRRTLPVPRMTRPELATAFVAARTPLESWLAAAWEETLGLEPVGIHDNFFELGGDSIKGVLLINRIQTRLGQIVHVVALFDAQTVADLAELLGRQYPETVVREFGAESLREPDRERDRRQTDVTDEVTAVSVARFRELAAPPPSPSAPGVDAAGRNRRSVFVLSPPRSGSTLLRVILGGHPRLFAPPELELLSFATLRERKAAFSGRDAYWLEGTMRALMELRGVSGEQSRRLMEELEERQLTTKAFYGELQGWLGERMLVDKTPSYALDVAALERAERDFVDPLYVHLVRHPCGMVRSFEEARLDQVFFTKPHGFSRRALAEVIWLVSEQNIARFLETVPAERVHTVRFEQLVARPDVEIGRLCGFLGIELDARMLEPYADARGRMTDGIHPESRMLGDVKFLAHGQIEAAVADRWRDDPRAEERLGALTWRMAEQLGYRRTAPARERDHGGRADTTALLPLDRIPRDRPLPLSFAQQRLWFIDQLSPGSPAYNMALAVSARGALDVAALERSVNEIVRRHEILRTTFTQMDGEPVQVVAPELWVPLVQVDLTDEPAPRRAEVARRLAHEDAHRPFDLARGPLLRTTLVKLGEDEHAYLLAMHHIVGDGWSMDILFREAAALYVAFTRGAPSPLPELPIQYADFAHWQRQWLQGPVLHEQVEYWKEVLRGAETLDLPTDRPRPAVQTNRGATHTFPLPAALTARLRSVGSGEGCSLYMTLLAAFQLLLSRYARQDDVCVGSATANRNRTEIEPLIGFFVNTFVMRTDLGGDPTFRELLGRVRGVVLGAFGHQDVPFERIVEEVEPDRNLDREPLFQVAFSLQNAPRSSVSAPDLVFARLDSSIASSKYDLSLFVWEGDGKLDCALEYATDLFEEASIRRLAGHLEAVLDAVSEDPELRVAAVPLLTPQAAKEILDDWSGVRAPRDESDASVVELFERRAAATPEATAVVDAGLTWSYEELSGRADALAWELRARGVGPETLVGICLERSAAAIVAILGVLKSGGAWVPLDPEYPAERFRYIVDDARPPVVVTQRQYEGRFPAGSVDLVLVDGAGGGAPARGRGHPPRTVGPDHLAYVIYTSGSTGAPKGTLLAHRGLTNLVRAQIAAFGIAPDSRVLQFASLNFDASVSEIFTALVAGAALCVAPKEQTLPGDALWTTLRDLAITHVTLPPAVLGVPRDVELPALRTLVSAGEACDADLAARWSGACRFLNAYGPTEVTVCAAISPPLGDSGRQPPIGRPMPGAQCYVLDRRLQPTPVGVPGELYVGGVGLSRGYLRQPALTAERFVPHPFAADPGARLYRTGDLCRFLDDGQLEFLGRTDEQVKLRGYRIEPGEVAAVLRGNAGVRQAAVVARTDPGRGPVLVAYVEPDPAALDGAAAATAVAETPAVELWPSIAEYFVYDELLYHAMTNDERRNASYRVAIERAVAGKTVVDVGTGEDAVLARLCIAAGATKVYAIEYLEDSFRKARARVRLLGLADRIELIHGDARRVALPELVDVCVSEIVGPIGSMEGAVPILNDARRFLKPGGRMIPSRSVTRIAGVSLPATPDGVPGFSPVSAHYLQRIFEQAGRPFDVRLCARNLSYADLVTEAGDFEDLDFTDRGEPEYERRAELTVARAGRLDGLLLWLQLYTAPDEMIDILAHEHCWLPVFLPVFTPGLDVSAGDRLVLRCITALSDNGLNPDYRVQGSVIRASGARREFDVWSRHVVDSFRGSAFYEAIFPGGTPKIGSGAPRGGGSRRPLEAGRVLSWQRLYEETYFDSGAPGELAENFTGWNSSYTGQAIPREEMREWVDGTVARLRSLEPQRVLEIGCGNGLLLARIAPSCAVYVGTDFAQAALDHCERIVRDKGLAGVTLLRRSADEWEGVAEQAFDLVILNSVVQYFPSVEYLRAVLEGAVRALAPGGSVFVGDVRSLPLLEAFHVSVEMERASPSMACDRVWQQARRRALAEQELVVAPDFFTAFAETRPALTRVETRLKPGPSPNELSRFRYDVVLTTRRPHEVDVDRVVLDWAADDLGLPAIRGRLAGAGPAALVVRGIPNARVSEHMRATELLRGRACPPTVGKLRERLALAAPRAVDPDSVVRLGEAEGFDVETTWSGAPDRFDALFIRRGGGVSPRILAPLAAAPPAAADWRTYANNPLREGVLQELVRGWSRDLRSRLPEYMLPAAIVAVEALPLTPNGKLDRKALPAPDFLRLDGQMEYVAPRDALEAQLAQLWEEVLHMHPVGVRDNFFDIGGHSMLAIRLLTRVQQSFGRKIPLTALFHDPTIERLAAVLRDPPARGARSSVVLLQQGGDRPPLFCMHPGGGTVFCYRALARHLGSDQPVYGLQARGVDGAEAPDTSLPEMVAHYAAEIRRVQPRGPYYLAGWSLGGLIAWEVSQRLVAAGEAVAVLALVDSMPVPQDRPPLAEFLGDRGIDDATVLAYMFGEDMGFTVEDLRRLPPDDQLQFCLTRLQQAGLVPADFAQADARPLLEVYRANFVAAYESRPEPYPGHAVLFRPEQDHEDKDATLARLRTMARDGLDVIPISGSHLTLMTEPHVAALARHLRACIDRALAAAPWRERSAGPR